MHRGVLGGHHYLQKIVIILTSNIGVVQTGFNTGIYNQWLYQDGNIEPDMDILINLKQHQSFIEII